MNSKYFTGLIGDPRMPSEKLLDHNHEELVMTFAADPFGNAKITQSPFTLEDQKGVSSCVPHGVGLALAIERARQTDEGYARLSWLFAYVLRSNFPTLGCWVQNIFDNFKNIGAPLFSLLPDVDTEDQATSTVITSQMRTEAQIYKGLNYVQLATANDITAIASIASMGHPVPITFYSRYDEWALAYPQIKDPTLQRSDPMAEVDHCVCVLPNSGFIENGIRYVTIQDSAHFGDIALRYVSEQFIAARVFGAGYWIALAVLGTGPLPAHTFTKVLKPGMNDSEVVWLQKLLIAEGFLRSDCATGYFGGMTLGGLHAFQNKYAADILLPLGLDAPTNTFGSFSIAKANALCAPKP